MPTRDELHQWDRRRHWHAFTQMQEYEPLIFVRGQGCRLWDIDGNEYLDGVSSLWCNVHGHRHPRIDAAVRGQLDRVAHVTNLGAGNPSAIELAERLVEVTPPGLDHVFFSDDGATAVEVALKIAFQYQRQRKTPTPEKTMFVAFGEAYHGDTLGVVSVGGVARFHKMFKPLVFDVLRVPSPGMYRLPEDVTRANACEYHLSHLRAVFEQHGDKIAAVVLEPLVQGAAGIVTQPAGFLRAARELTRRFDALLIADEVAVGFGRTGRMFACEHEDVTPDLMCLGKGITGGYLPVAATLATREIYEAFLGEYGELKTFFHGHTYGGNPLGCAAALASLAVFEEEQTISNLPPKIARLSEHLARIAELPHVGDVRQCGMMAGIELVADKATAEPFDFRAKRGYRVCAAAREKGVWLRPLGDVIVIMPPLAITLEELDQVCQAAEYGIRVATGKNPD